MPDSNARPDLDQRALARRLDTNMLESELLHEVHERYPQPVPIDDLERQLTFPLSEHDISSRRSEIEEALTRLFQFGLVHIMERGYVMVTQAGYRAIELWSYVGDYD